MLEKFKKIQKECNELIDYLEQSDVPNEEVDDILFKYKEDLKQNAWWLDACGYCKNNLNHGVDFNETDLNPFMYYPSRTYAKMAQTSKILYDTTLAFKWCYDRDFKPDWSNNQEKRYYLSFDHFMGIFVIREAYSLDNPGSVYFSSEEIAKACANWLNDTYHLSLKGRS